MKINLTIARTAPANPPGVYEARRYGDPFMIANMGLSYNIVGSNFQNISLFTPSSGFKGTTTFQRLDEEALTYLRSIQVADEYTVDQKWAWLWGPGRPYFDARGVPAFGTIVFGGQRVRVEMVNGIPQPYEFFARYQETDVMQTITFYKLQGIRKSEFGRPLAELLAEGKVQQCTAVGEGDRYIDKPRGVIYHPVWDTRDYPSNYGELYIARSFLL